MSDHAASLARFADEYMETRTLPLGGLDGSSSLTAEVYPHVGPMYFRFTATWPDGSREETVRPMSRADLRAWGTIPPEKRARVGWRRFNRVTAWFNTCLAAVAWVIFAAVAWRDWTVIFAPLLFTTGVTVQWMAIRKVYGVRPEPERPRPDYAAIARMEREIWGEAFRHEGAPEPGGASALAIPETAAELEALLNDDARMAEIIGSGQLDRFTRAYVKVATDRAARVREATARCCCNYCKGRAGVHGEDAVALYRAESEAAMRKVAAAGDADARSTLNGAYETVPDAEDRERGRWLHWVADEFMENGGRLPSSLPDGCVSLCAEHREYGDPAGGISIEAIWESPSGRYRSQTFRSLAGYSLEGGLHRVP